MCDKMAISTYIMKIAENDPFLRLQMRAIEMFRQRLRDLLFFLSFSCYNSEDTF